MNRLVDSLLEEIGDQLESLGLDPLPIPDIRIPYSLDTVSVLSYSPYNVYTYMFTWQKYPPTGASLVKFQIIFNLNPGDWLTDSECFLLLPI